MLRWQELARRAALTLVLKLGGKSGWAHRKGLTDMVKRSIMRSAGNRVKMERLVRTEVSKSYNQVLTSARFKDRIVIKHWNARLEACPVCAKLHGQTALVGEDYPSGDEPGEVHPNCACFSTFEFLS